MRCKYSLDAAFLLASLSKQGLYKFCWQCVAVTRVTEILFPCSGSSKTQKKKTLCDLNKPKTALKALNTKDRTCFPLWFGEAEPSLQALLPVSVVAQERVSKITKKSQIHRGSVTKENIPALRSISVFLQPYFNWLILGLKYKKVWHL